MKPCQFCGGDGPELAEAWNLEAGELLIDACCEPALALANEAWADPQFLNELGVGYLIGSPVRRVHTDLGLQPVIDCRLSLCAISQADAKRFVTAVHRHCPAPVGWRFGFGVRNGSRLVGVAMCGRPVARLIDANTVVEVNRLATIDSPLAHNAASMLLGAAAREARRRGFLKAITYTLESECGASLRGAGWVAEAVTRGGTRTRRGRVRSEHAVGPKVRWACSLQ